MRVGWGGSSRVGGQIGRCLELQLVVEHAARVVARQVPVCVVGEVDDGGLVGLGFEFEAQFIALGPLVSGRRGQLAGIAHFAVGRHVLEYGGRIGVLYKCPHLVLEAFGAAVEAVGTVVDRQGVLNAVECEVTLGNAVGKAAGHLAGAGAVGEIVEGVGIA